MRVLANDAQRPDARKKARVEMSRRILRWDSMDAAEGGLLFGEIFDARGLSPVGDEVQTGD